MNEVIFDKFGDGSIGAMVVQIIRGSRDSSFFGWGGGGKEERRRETQEEKTRIRKRSKAAVGSLKGIRSKRRAKSEKKRRK